MEALDDPKGPRPAHREDSDGQLHRPFDWQGGTVVQGLQPIRRAVSTLTRFTPKNRIKPAGKRH